MLALSINLTDLKIVFDLLPSVPQKLHYLQRRREIEANVKYVGDEIDLLAWYLDSGFNIGKNEYQQNAYYYLILKSKELDPYIICTGKGQSVNKPSLKMSTGGKINRLEATKPQLWLENSFILLNFGEEEQNLFKKMVKELT